MGKYNFDEEIDRWGSGCYKYDGMAAEYGRRDLEPFWVADMDFRTPECITDALRRRIDHPVFGYPATPKEYFPTIAAWVRDIHGWEVNPAHMCYIPGIVKGIGFVLDCFCRPGDKVIVQPPVYHPFRIVPQGHKLEVVWNPLLPVEGEDGFVKGYEMDLDGLEKLIDEKTKVLILSNPHNPAGVCWAPETLRRVAEIASAHGILVVSDEIHSEMVLGGGKHHPFASVSPAAADCSITFMAPSKTFNIAGIVSSYAIVSNPEIRERFYAFLEADELDYAPIFSVVATMAAYTRGADWRREMLAYVQGNVDFVDAFLKAEIPQIGCLKPQASFLVWLDCRKLDLKQEELVSLFVDKAHLLLNDGAMFGPGGAGFMRLNVGCPRARLAAALRRLKEALQD